MLWCHTVLRVPKKPTLDKVKASRTFVDWHLLGVVHFFHHFQERTKRTLFANHLPPCQKCMHEKTIKLADYLVHDFMACLEFLMLLNILNVTTCICIQNFDTISSLIPF